MKLDFSKSKIGDKVYSITEGNGVIIDIGSDDEYPIFVKFEKCNHRFTYTLDGKFNRYSKNPTLYWGNYDSQDEFFKSDKKYEPSWYPKVGELVFANNNIGIVIKMHDYDNFIITQTDVKLHNVARNFKLNDLKPIDKERLNLIKSFYGNDKS